MEITESDSLPYLAPFYISYTYRGKMPPVASCLNYLLPRIFRKQSPASPFREMSTNIQIWCSWINLPWPRDCSWHWLGMHLHTRDRGLGWEARGGGSASALAAICGRASVNWPGVCDRRRPPNRPTVYYGVLNEFERFHSRELKKIKEKMRNRLELFKKVSKEKNDKKSPRRGIEPRSPAWQAGILTTILTRIRYLIDNFYSISIKGIDLPSSWCSTWNIFLSSSTDIWWWACKWRKIKLLSIFIQR